MVLPLTEQATQPDRPKKGVAGFDRQALRDLLADALKAREIQVHLLPHPLPVDGRMSVAGYSEPSRTVGGDFYDWLPLDEHRVAIVIADASGKGLPAAMLMVQTQAILRSELRHDASLAAALDTLNGHLLRTTTGESFVTLFLGAFDRRSGAFEYTNAGHICPVLVRRNGSIERLEAGGLPLGIVPNYGCSAGAAVLRPGDLLCFVTDGVTESTNRAGDEYGEGRLVNAIKEARHLDALGVIEHLIADLRDFEDVGHGATLHDDRTVLVLRANPALNAR